MKFGKYSCASKNDISKKFSNESQKEIEILKLSREDFTSNNDLIEIPRPIILVAN